MSFHKPEDLRRLKPRLMAMMGFCFFIFLLLVGRLCQLQVLEGRHYASKAKHFVDKVSVPAPRGRIFDVHGKPLAINLPKYTLYVTARPKVLHEGEDASKPAYFKRITISDEEIIHLAKLLEFANEEQRLNFIKTIQDRRRDAKTSIYPFAVKDYLSHDESTRIQARTHEFGHWVEVRETALRAYPQAELTAFISGYVGEVSPEILARSRNNYHPGDRIGKTGIERQWENYLRGRAGIHWRVVDSHGRVVSDPPASARAVLPANEEPIPGQDIYLTIDLELQQAASKAFSHVSAGALVAMEVDTGRIVAMLSLPAIDPNLWQHPISSEQFEQWKQSPFKPFIDRTVQEHFFPGSTYKVVSALAALSDPTFDPERTIECNGYVKYGGRTFKCTHQHGPVNLEQAIVQSCNVYFFTLAMEELLTLEQMEQFAKRLGLGQKTGLNLNFEASGRIPTPASEAREGSYQLGVRLNSAIGQGNVKVTVLQLAVLYAAIANGGQVITPYLVDRIETSEHKVVMVNQAKIRNDLEPISLPDRNRIHTGLLGVVHDPLGTAFSERFADIQIAGKTGTAQVGAADRKHLLELKEKNPELKDWDPTKDHAWFVAYAPAEAPEIVVAVFVENGGAGADAAAPIVMQVIRAYMDKKQANRHPSLTPLRAPGVPPPLPGTQTTFSASTVP